LYLCNSDSNEKPKIDSLVLTGTCVKTSCNITICKCLLNYV